MLAKKTVKNQITLPKKIADTFPDIEYFDVRTEDGCIIFTPIRMGQSEATRKKLKTLKISEKDIADAVSWARKAGS